MRLWLFFILRTSLLLLAFLTGVLLRGAFRLVSPWLLGPVNRAVCHQENVSLIKQPVEIMIPSCLVLLTYLIGKKILPEMLKLLAGVIRNPAKQCCRPISNGDLSRHGMRATTTTMPTPWAP